MPTLKTIKQKITVTVFAVTLLGLLLIAHADAKGALWIMSVRILRVGEFRCTFIYWSNADITWSCR